MLHNTGYPVSGIPLFSTSTRSKPTFKVVDEIIMRICQHLFVFIVLSMPRRTGSLLCSKVRIVSRAVNQRMLRVKMIKVADIHDAPTGTATSDIVQNRKFSCNLLKKRVLSTNREYFNKSASKKLKKWVFVTLI